MLVTNVLLKSRILFKKSFCSYSTAELLRYVPKHKPVQENEFNKLKEFITTSTSLVILTGAGISTESGINFTIADMLYNLIPIYRNS